MERAADVRWPLACNRLRSSAAIVPIQIAVEGGCQPNDGNLGHPEALPAPRGRQPQRLSSCRSRRQRPCVFSVARGSTLAVLVRRWRTLFWLGSHVVCASSGEVQGAADEESAAHESTLLYGNINLYAYYFADLLVGSVPQRISVIVDTGSALCGFPCKDCGHCGPHLDAPFNFEESSTFEPLPCHSMRCDAGCQRGLCAYSQSYAEGSSVTGFWFQDKVQLADRLQPNAPVNATLGCHIDERKLFYTQRVNGIMGLAPRRRKDGRPTILQELFRDKAHISTSVFALCLSEWGGIMTIGGANSAYHVNGSSLAWLPMETSQGYYTIKASKLAVDKVTLAWNTQDFGNEIIVDSGTTFCRFPSQLYMRLVEAIEAYCEAPAPGGCHKAVKKHDDCWLMEDPASDMSAFPSLTFHVGDQSLVWPPHAYLYKRSEMGLFCYAFADGGNTPTTILGVSFLLHKDIVFDLHSARLGVAEARCPEHRRAPGEDAGFLQDDTYSSSLRIPLMAVAAFALLLGFTLCCLAVFGCGWPLASERRKMPSARWDCCHDEDEDDSDGPEE
eukprot:TRINITY_DN41206_c0_g1_i1.p1 TRINITY_DN41206_c0_g1~~TRINITY_DN41206_c0_g1_i1.p1  ORF type:complete len:581 (+),score=78.28 TRINITY_DN41206_c0_g1_i1:71-1744(+)